MLSPVQINEEAEQVVTQFNHGLLHVGLELTSVVDLSGVKDTHVSHRNLHVPAGTTKSKATIHLLCDVCDTEKIFRLQPYSNMHCYPEPFQTLPGWAVRVNAHVRIS